MSKKTVIEYPVGLGRVPYASFIEINKYAYSEAQKTVAKEQNDAFGSLNSCLLYTSPSPRDATLSRMPSSA